MSVHSASHVKCVACDFQASMLDAQSNWWICTTCGSYMCPNCRVIFLERRQGICPGTIVRGVESHSPHFTRFLVPREEPDEPEFEQPAKVVILDDAPRLQQRQPGGKVIILPDEVSDFLEIDESETREDNAD